MKQLLLCGFLIGLLAASSGCGTTGKDFDESFSKKIVNGTTTQQEVEHMLGTPFKKGIQNGSPVWTYEYDKYRVFGEGHSKNIMIVFDSHGVVKSHQLMSSQPSP